MAIRTGRRVPSFVPIFNPIAQRLLRLGARMGPNTLLTVRGRRSGQPRTTPVAVVRIDGRRWIIAPFGDVHWVRNLRAAGEGTIGSGRRAERVRAVELDRTEAEAFFTGVLGPYIRRMVVGRLIIGSFLGAGDVLDDPHAAARRVPVFELHPAAVEG